MRPNIVFILIDDLGWKDLGCTGSRYYQTPHIDQVAADGVCFTQAYACSPICSPSRGAIYSGQYPARSKFSAVTQPHLEPDDRLYDESKPVRGNVQQAEALHHHCLPPSVPTIAEMLTPAGYNMGFVGKWHCGWNPAHQPDRRGWGHAEGFRTVPSGTRGHFGRDFTAYRCKDMEGLQDDAYMTDVLTDRAVNFLHEAAAQDAPFFLTLSHYAVHMPLDAPADLIAKYRELPTCDQDNPVYAAMIEKVDDSVGRVAETLRELGLEANTMLVFTSDNGGFSPKATSNYPLMGGKSFCYEAGMRVPLIVKWPAKVEAGRCDATRTVAVDFVPTWLEMAGVTAPENTCLDGESLVPLLQKGTAPAPRPIFCHHPHYTHAAGPFSSVILDDWKLIRFYNDTAGAEQLFDMSADPYEQTDLCGARPERARVLREALDAWLAATHAELPRENPDFDTGQAADFDKTFTWELALKERAMHAAKLQGAGIPGEGV